MAGKLEWHGDEAAKAIEAEVNRRLHRCCVTVLNHAKTLINVNGTGVSTSGGGRDAKGRYRKKSKKLRYGAHPSAPGEPPRKQTGRLLASVAWEVSGLVGRVGTNLPYGRWLELGTRLMAARPWLRRALAECRDKILAILSAPMK